MCSELQKLHQVLFGGVGGHVAVALAIADALPNCEHHLTFYGTNPPALQTEEQCLGRGIDYDYVTKKSGLDLAALNDVFHRLINTRTKAVLMHSVTAMPAGWLWEEESGGRLVVVDHTAPAAKSRTEWLALALSLLTTHVITLTESNRQAVLNRLSLLKRYLGPINIIPNGINTDYFTPTGNSVSSKVRIVMMARFCKERDFIGLIQAVEMLLSRDSTLRDKLELVLAGDGDTWKDVKHYVDQNGLGELVRMPGFIGEDEVRILLQSSSIYVQWSSADSMSTSVMQAMSCGVPVVASKIDGMDALVDHGETGFLEDLRDVSGLASRLWSLTHDRDLCVRLGQNGREKIMREFSHYRMAQEYLRLFEGLEE